MVIAGSAVEPVAAAGAWPAWAVGDVGVAAFVLVVGFLAATFFFGAGFFFALGVAGIGMVMPGICWCCAAAGAAARTSAIALAVANNFVFTESLPNSELDREIQGLSGRRRRNFAEVRTMQHPHGRIQRRGQGRDFRPRNERRYRQSPEY